MINCKRCGKCCYFWEDGVYKKCRFLLYITPLHTICRIYNSKDRLGRRLGKVARCGLRKDSSMDYPNCPYNTNKPIEKGKSDG